MPNNAPDIDAQTILIIDDEPANLSVMVAHLRDYGFDLMTARNGLNGLEKAQRDQPDLILLDVVLPDIDGYEVCRRLKAAPETCDIPVIFLSARASTSDKLSGFEAGGVDYITKPSQAPEVLARVSIQLKNHTLQRTLSQRNETLKQEVARREATEKHLRVFSEAIEQVASSISISDTKGTIEFVNSAFVANTGYSRQEVIGNSPRLFQSGLTDKAVYASLWRTIQRGDIWRGEVQNSRKDRSLYWEAMVISPIRDHHGNISHYLTVREDITQRREAEAALRRSEADLARAQAIARMGSFRHDLRSNQVSWSRGLCDLFGLTPAIPHSHDLRRVIHPADLAVFEHSISTAIAHGYAELDARILHADRDVRVIHAQFETCYDSQQEPLEIFGIIQDITEHKRNEEALRQAKHAAEEASRAKTSFLANMSHEIRTPLNAVLGFTEILAGILDDPRHKDYLHAIQISGKSLLNLINDILDLSKIEAGKLHIDLKETNLRPVFHDMGVIFSTRQRDKGLQFILDIADDVPNGLLLDEVRLRQILLNLVGNAFKFTEQGFVKLNVWVEWLDIAHNRLNLHFSVSDSGIGIPATDHQQIFGAFEQRSGQNINQYGGTGLGLAIVKRLLAMMNGNIELRSEEAQGAEFAVVLNDVAVVKNPDLTQSSLAEVDIDAIQFEPAQILLIDPLDLNRSLLTAYLSPFGFSIIEAKNGSNALKLMQLHQPDLVLVDEKTPGLAGGDVLRQLQKPRKNQTIPVLALTASSPNEPLGKLAASCDGYLSKPLSKVPLIQALQHYLPHCLPVPSAPEAADTYSNELMPATLYTLLQTEILPIWQALDSNASVNEIENFAASMLMLAEQHHCVALHRWANTLHNQAALFDMEALHVTLQAFTQFTDPSPPNAV